MSQQEWDTLAPEVRDAIRPPEEGHASLGDDLTGGAPSGTILTVVKRSLLVYTVSGCCSCCMVQSCLPVGHMHLGVAYHACGLHA